MAVKVAIDTKALSEACARFGVARLRVFGSVLNDHFDPQASDIDFLVDFQAGREDRFADFFGLQDELTRIFGRKIDLIVAESVKNPYFKSSVLRGAEDVYAAGVTVLEAEPIQVAAGTCDGSVTRARIWRVEKSQFERMWNHCSWRGVRPGSGVTTACGG